MLCRCPEGCALWSCVAIADRQADENGPGWRALVQARAVWLDHVLTEAPCLDEARFEVAA